MKSRFAFGMFAGFALACLFFFFFLFFFPNVFRTLTAKKSPTYPNPVAMMVYPPDYNAEYVAYSNPAEPVVPIAGPVYYEPYGYTAEQPNREHAPADPGSPRDSKVPYRLNPGTIAYYDHYENAPYENPGSYTPGLS